ncbi:rhodanese-like domain-containing protein [Haliangium sp.]|uniref:rhodanese-like domain-containing protein n=1 Tax=Haliangium sp. TaxID=2663208 RepID=UPI003D09B175
MDIKRIAPKEAATLMEQGWTYVDVRSVPEFEQGHPAGAWNVPFMHRAAGGMQPNPDFLAVMQAAFAADTPLIVGCQTGRRSLRAAETLVQHGFTQVVDMRGGLAGERNPAGQVVFPGWRDSDLPVARQAAPGQGYRDLETQRTG